MINNRFIFRKFSLLVLIAAFLCQSLFSEQEQVAKNEAFRKSFFESAYKGNVEEVREFIKAGIDVNTAREKDGVTALLVATEPGHSEIINLLLSAGASVDPVRKTDGIAPLLLASFKGYTEIAGILINAGANVDIADTNGATPLYAASQNGYTEIVKLLLNAGADVNRACITTGATPIYTASLNGYTEIAGLLISAGADVNHATKKDNATPLFVASQNGHIGIVRLLISAGANVNASRKAGGVTPLWKTSQKGHIEIARLLIEAGADVNGADTGGVTPLLFASENNHIEIARLLLEAGANVNAADKKGVTPLWIATRKGYMQIARILRNAGAHINEAPPIFRITPLWGIALIIVILLVFRSRQCNIPNFEPWMVYLCLGVSLLGLSYGFFLGSARYPGWFGFSFIFPVGVPVGEVLVFLAKKVARRARNHRPEWQRLITDTLTELSYNNWILFPTFLMTFKQARKILEKAKEQNISSGHEKKFLRAALKLGLRKHFQDAVMLIFYTLIQEGIFDLNWGNLELAVSLMIKSHIPKEEAIDLLSGILKNSRFGERVKMFAVKELEKIAGAEAAKEAYRELSKSVSAFYLIDIADWYLNQGFKIMARTSYEQALEKDKNYKLRIGRGFAGLGDKDKAKNILTSIMRYSNDMYKAADLLREMGFSREADEMKERAVKEAASEEERKTRKSKVYSRRNVVKEWSIGGMGGECLRCGGRGIIGNSVDGFARCPVCGGSGQLERYSARSLDDLY